MKPFKQYFYMYKTFPKSHQNPYVSDFDIGMHFQTDIKRFSYNTSYLKTKSTLYNSDYPKNYINVKAVTKKGNLSIFL